MIVFRAFASSEAGYRRLQRCIYLGTALRKDVDILFCVDKDKQALELLKEKKFRVCLADTCDSIKKENPVAVVFTRRHGAPELGGCQKCQDHSTCRMGTGAARGGCGDRLRYLSLHSLPG